MEAPKLNANPIVKTQRAAYASEISSKDKSVAWLVQEIASSSSSAAASSSSSLLLSPMGFGFGGMRGEDGEEDDDVDFVADADADANEEKMMDVLDDDARNQASTLSSPRAPKREGFTPAEIYELVRDIRDPEHPLTLSELNVVSEKQISVDDVSGRVDLYFTPTVPHCSMSTLIGLCLRVKLLRSLPPRFKVDIFVEPGSHVSEAQVNKQLNDKERVAAALENGQLLQVVNKCLTGS